MRILLVRPRPSPETIGLQHVMVVEPLELEILGALKRDTDTVTIVDMILEKKPFEFFLSKAVPDVLCITGYITNVNTIKQYCYAAKKMFSSVTCVVGGVHCEVCPEDFDCEAIDYRVVRNAASIFTELLHHIEHNSGLPQGVFCKGDKLENNPLPPFDFQVPFADRNLVKRYRRHYFYIFSRRVALIKTSYGCPYRCSFCFCRIITRDTYHRKPMDEIITELEQINESEIYIVDDDFLFDAPWLERFADEIKRRNIRKRYLVYGRADFIANHPDVIRNLAEIGLKTVIVGFESFSDKELDQYNKKTSATLYRKTMETLNHNKVDVFATIIIPPDWDKGDFQNMIRTVRSLKIHFVNLQPLTPLPKTGIHFPPEQILLDPKKYEQWDMAHVAIRPSKLSVAEFYRQILKAYHSILYHPPALWRHIVSYPTVMLWKMLVGGYRVTKQYQQKIKNAERHA